MASSFEIGKFSGDLSPYTTIAAEAFTSPTAATFIPATRRTAAQTPLSPSATKAASDATASEKPLPPKAPEPVPATKTPKPVCAPRTSAERLSSTPEPLATSTPRDLLALLEHCRRRIVQRVQVLRQRGQLPSRFGRNLGQDLLESAVSCDGFEAACDSKLVFLVARYKAIKAQLDAPVNLRR